MAAVAVVAQAVLGMARTLAPDRSRATLAAVAAIIALAIPSAWSQLGAIVFGCVVGLALLRVEPQLDHNTLPVSFSRTTGVVLLVLFFAMLIALPLVAALTSNQGVKEFDAFYRAGSLVFGGGHVILPLLQASVVSPGWVTADAFLAGYGAAQAVPVR